MITPQSIGLTILIPILARCHPDLLLEQAGEVLRILEAEFVGHLIDGQLVESDSPSGSGGGNGDGGSTQPSGDVPGEGD